MLKVNQENCVNCGICTRICPSGIIKNGENGPQMLLPQACIACGHCVAICPQAALDNDNTPMNKQVDLEKFPVIDPRTAAIFMRSRRSTRSYRKEQVKKETLLELLNIARFAPSAANSQGLSYIVYENPELLKGITKVTVDWLEEMTQKGLRNYKGLVNTYRKTGKDVVLRGAPQLIVATAPGNLPNGRDNGHFSLTYLELYATALGLGTCWAGFVEGCAQAGYQPLIELLNLPEDRKVAGAVMVGYPEYTFKRLVDKNPLNVTWR
ncbi:MAG: nitroreductase family protein [Clostridia bacterium]|nr:nitroreductase family protein [Clostridia bacterium]